MLKSELKEYEFQKMAFSADQLGTIWYYPTSKIFLKLTYFQQGIIFYVVPHSLELFFSYSSYFFLSFRHNDLQDFYVLNKFTIPISFFPSWNALLNVKSSHKYG